jgi:hypothetical protein
MHQSQSALRILLGLQAARQKLDANAAGSTGPPGPNIAPRG